MNKRKIKGLIYICLRLLVIICMIRQLLNHNWTNVFTCILVLISFLLPAAIDKKFKIKLPDILEISLVLFVFAAEILGEINAFYLNLNNFDTLLHTINGFIMGGVGFSVINILNKSSDQYFSLAPIYVVVASFCFSMTIGVLWEFCEYTNDQLMKADGQKDTIVTQMSSVLFNEEGKNIPINKKIYSVIVNGEDWTKKYGGYIDMGLIDTMKDLFVNLIGAVTFSIFGWFYLRGKNKFAENFIPEYKKTQENS